MYRIYSDMVRVNPELYVLKYDEYRGVKLLMSGYEGFSVFRLLNNTEILHIPDKGSVRVSKDAPRALLMGLLK